MLAWTVLSEDDAAESWNALALDLEEVSPFHSYEFGQYYRHLGWHPLYCACFDNNRHLLAMALCVTKTWPGRITIGWCFGGPVGSIATWADLPTVIARSRGTRHTYLRFRCDRESTEADARALIAAGWKRPTTPMGRCLTLVLNLAASEQDLLGGFSKNWRRNLRRAQEKGLAVTCNEEAISLQLFDAYREMAKFKNLDSPPEYEKIKRLAEKAGKTITIFVARDADGHLLAFRCALVLGDRAVDYLAATTVRGRQLHAAYQLFWVETSVLKARGIVHYDLGGIDPEANPGVYRFKRDTGAQQITLLGEWEAATTVALGVLVNMALRLRGVLRSARRVLGRGSPAGGA